MKKFCFFLTSVLSAFSAHGMLTLESFQSVEGDELISIVHALNASDRYKNFLSDELTPGDGYVFITELGHHEKNEEAMRELLCGGVVGSLDICGLRGKAINLMHRDRFGTGRVFNGQEPGNREEGESVVNGELLQEFGGWGRPVAAWREILRSTVSCSLFLAQAALQREEVKEGIGNLAPWGLGSFAVKQMGRLVDGNDNFAEIFVVFAETMYLSAEGDE